MLDKMLTLWIQTSIFQLVPRGSNGEAKLTVTALFSHVCLYHIIMLGREGARKYEGSNHIELSLGKIHMECIHPTNHELKRGHIIRDSVLMMQHWKWWGGSSTLSGTCMGIALCWMALRIWNLCVRVCSSRIQSPELFVVIQKHVPKKYRRKRVILLVE